MTPFLYTLEAFSLFISILLIVINLRTPVMIKGEASLKWNVVLKHYKQNGFYADLIGCLPTNLLLGHLLNKEYIILIAICRAIRIGSVWRCVQLFGRFESFLKKHSLMMHILKAVLLLYLLWHWLACLWYFLNLNLEE